MNIISLPLKIILEITWGLSIETILDKLDDMSLLKKVQDQDRKPYVQWTNALS